MKNSRIGTKAWPEPQSWGGGGDAGAFHISPRVTATQAMCRGCREDQGGRGCTEKPLSCLSLWWVKVTGTSGGGGRKDGSRELQEAARQQPGVAQRGEHPAEPQHPFEIWCLYTIQREGFLPKAPAQLGNQLLLRVCLCKPASSIAGSEKKKSRSALLGMRRHLPPQPPPLCKTFTSLNRHRQRSKHSSRR